MGELRINISKLSEGTHRYSLSAEPARIGLGDDFQGPIRLEARLDKTSRQVLLSLDMAASGNFHCDRCLEPFVLPLNGSFRMVFVTDEREGDTLNDEVRVLNPDTNVIELDEDVRQFLELAVPRKLLCRDDCQGLCPTCGVNKNTDRCSCTVELADPRWDALRKIAKN